MTTYTDETADKSGDTSLTTNTTIVVRGQHVSATPAVLKSVAPASTVYTFSHAFTHQFGAQTVHYRAGGSYILDAATKAILLAAGAPMTAA